MIEAGQRTRRRYVSARAGSYPPAVRPRRSAAPEQAAPEPAPAAAVDDIVVVAPPAAALSPAETVRMQAPVLPAPEPRPEKRPPGLVQADFAALVAAEMSTPEADPTETTIVPVDFPPAVKRRSNWAQFPVRRMLITATIGGLIGVLVGFVLLALQSEHQLASLMEPGSLWASADSRLRVMVVLFATGFAMLGTLAARRRRRDRR